MIISVGYRVNSRQATQFRIWATNVLRKHLIDGYTLNELRLKEKTDRLEALQKSIKLISAVKTRKELDYEDAISAVEELRKKFNCPFFFGKEKDKSFRSSIDAIYQTFDNKELYPSVEEKAANLLYFIVKNHSFVDGNKRIAASIFLWFLEKNKLLYRNDGTKRIADNALTYDS